MLVYTCYLQLLWYPVILLPRRSCVVVPQEKDTALYRASSLSYLAHACMFVHGFALCTLSLITKPFAQPLSLFDTPPRCVQIVLH